MQITSEHLQSQIAGLLAQREQHIAHVNAINGKVELCNALLVRLAQPDPSQVAEHFASDVQTAVSPEAIDDCLARNPLPEVPGPEMLPVVTDEPTDITFVQITRQIDEPCTRAFEAAHAPKPNGKDLPPCNPRCAACTICLPTPSELTAAGHG